MVNISPYHATDIELARISQYFVTLGSLKHRTFLGAKHWHIRTILSAFPGHMQAEAVV